MSAPGTRGTASESDEPTGPLPAVSLPAPPPVDRARRRFGGRRAVIAVVAVIVIAGVSVGVWLTDRKTSSAAAVTVSTETASVTTGTMKQSVSTSGTIEPGSEADLDFAVSGAVTAVDVATGATVTKGQVLATVDPSALAAEVQAASASLSAAQDTLTSDRSSDASTSQIDGDEASVTSATTQLASARTARRDASLRSTLTGTIAAVDLTVGQQVSGSGGSSASSSTGATTSGGGSSTGASSGTGSSTASAATGSSSSTSSAQITVIDTHSYTVTTTVDDTEVGQVKVGDQAVITPGSSTTAVYGTVSSVGLIASDSSDVATFPVDIAVTGSPAGLYAGASATVAIITRQLDDVVEVPTAAITYAGGSAEVTAVDGGRHVTTPITTGVTSDGETQVTKGLAAGDKVLERVVRFNASAAGGRSLFGGGTGSSGGFSRGAGGFGGGGSFGGGGAGFGGAPAGGGSGG